MIYSDIKVADMKHILDVVRAFSNANTVCIQFATEEEARAYMRGARDYADILSRVLGRINDAGNKQRIRYMLNISRMTRYPKEDMYRGLKLPDDFELSDYMEDKNE